MKSRSPTEIDIFNAALELDDPAQRERYLSETCSGNTALRTRLDALLDAHGRGVAMFEPLAPTVSRLNTELPAGHRIGSYRVIEKLGEGGCGVVYIAEQHTPVRRRVALKVIKAGMDTRSVIARFEAERQALAMMDHPCIAKVFEAGSTEQGRPYFAMELVQGEKITTYCDRKKLSLEARLQLFVEVCHAVQHAHQKGIIHRDLKPSNVLVTDSDNPIPKIIDFGVAKAISGRLTEATYLTGIQQLIGTPAYMSPEQALITSEDIDTRTDIYSLGILLYELLAGRPPFDNHQLLTAGLDEMRRIIGEVEPQRPSQAARVCGQKKLSTLHSSLSTDLDWIVMKCLEKDRPRRYATANDLATDIKRFLDHEPVAARPPSVTYRFQKLVRRNKLAFAASAAVIVALAVGLVVSIWLFFREATAHQRTLAAEREQARLREKATEELWHSYLATARANRRSGVPGQRYNSLAAISNAAAIRPSLELRNEAIATLALTDLGPARFGQDTPWAGTHLQGLPTAFDSELRRIALLAQDGSIYVHRVADHAELLHIPSPNTNGIAAGGGALLFFSPDGRHLAWRCPNGLYCWQLEPLRLRIEARHPPELLYSFGFSADSRWLLAGERSQDLSIYSLAGSSPSDAAVVPVSRPDSVLKLSILPNHFAFDPSGTRLAITDRWQVQIWKWPEREFLRSFSDSNQVSNSIWYPDSRHLFLGTWRGTIDVWDSLRQSYRSLAGHLGTVSWLALHPRGDVLASDSWDGTSKLWDMATDTPLLTIEEGLPLRFSNDGRQLGFQEGTHRYGVWPVAISRVFRSLASVSGLRDRASLDFSSDGRVLLWADEFGLWWVDLHSGRYERHEVPGLQHARFNADASAVLLAGDDGLKRLPLRRTLAPNSIGLEFAGAAESVGTNRFSLAWPMKIPWDRAVVIASERWLSPNQNRVLITDDHGAERTVRSPSKAAVSYTALSPDGRWLALGHYIDSTYVLDAHTGAIVKHWPELQFADVIFTPDGRWLVTGTGQEYRFWEIGTWQPGLRVERGTAFPNPGQMVFSNDGRVLAIMKGLKTIELLDWQTGEIIADLVPAHPQHIRAFAFSPDNSILAMVAVSAVHLWDLRELRRELAALKLDWNQPPLASSTNSLADVVFRFAAEDAK